MERLSLLLTHVGIKKNMLPFRPCCAVSTEEFPGKKGKVRIKQSSWKSANNHLVPLRSTHNCSKLHQACSAARS